MAVLVSDRSTGKTPNVHIFTRYFGMRNFVTSLCAEIVIPRAKLQEYIRNTGHNDGHMIITDTDE